MPERRPRADAQRSVAAILDAAVAVLRARPAASMDEIARAAGVARQTVYAHYASRDALITAVGERALHEAVAAIEAAGLAEGPPAAALERLVDTSWRMAERHGLFQIPFPRTSADEERAAHGPILDPLERLVRRGQRAGAFDREAAPAWLLAAFIGLVHAAAEEVAAGRMSSEDGLAAARRAVLRVFGAR